MESIHCFKAQGALGVVLSELDFETLDEPAKSRLSVGITRANMLVEMVVSSSCERAIADMLH